MGILSSAQKTFINSNEDQLLSCSYDKSIKVWKVNYFENNLEFDYTLDQMHSEPVTCISLNEQDTALVSCSLDKKIILWIRDKQNKWIYQNQISNDDYGNRISFISENQIVWQQYSVGITRVFQIENGKLQNLPQFSLSLNQFSEDDWLFPTIYNTQRQIIVQKHNKFVYILKKKENGELLRYKQFRLFDLRWIILSDLGQNNKIVSSLQSKVFLSY